MKLGACWRGPILAFRTTSPMDASTSTNCPISVPPDARGRGVDPDCVEIIGGGGAWVVDSETLKFLSW